MTKKAPTNVAIFTFPFGDLFNKNGITASVVSWRKFSDNSTPTQAKMGGNYLNSIIATQEAKRNGVDEAILLDQKIRGEGALRTIYLYPMALSFIVTGTAWKWFLDPGIGLEHIMHQWGWESFEFRWIKDRTFAIYTVVIAAVWQSSGFVMAMFLAGLRGIDGEIMKAAQIDGASGFKIYRRIIIPMLRPAFLSAFVILAHLSIKAYDLVIALTNGGPGRATEVPATFMYAYTFSRNQMGVGATSAIIMLIMIFSIIIPYLYSELRSENQS